MASTSSLLLLLSLIFFLGAFAYSYSASPSSPPNTNTTISDALLDFKAHFVVHPSSRANASSDFCSWEGISCFYDYNQLYGLSLSSLGLHGTVSPQIGNLQELSFLDLSHNQLSGPLPSSLGQLNSCLYHLDLSYNQLSAGPLPPLPLDFFGFLNVSYNRLEGMIPMVYIQKFSSDSFLGNPGLCAPFLLRSCAKSNIKLDVLVVVCVVGPVGLVASFCVWWYCFHRKDLGSNFVVPQYKAWTTEEMKAATNNFDATTVIGSGSVSTCYLGVMKLTDGMRVVALKRLIVDDKDDDGMDDEARKSFVNEFKTLSKLRHRNLVKVMGYCVEGGEIALVMEYMEGGDLDKRLHNEAKNLSWEERVNVALDVAEGLVYLHHECEQPIIHCDLKPKNILLRSDMVAKISDFGISRILDVKERGDMSMSKFRGSFGYIAPGDQLNGAQKGSCKQDTSPTQSQRDAYKFS